MSDPAAAIDRMETSDSPDWSNIEGEFPCPLCRYNLRGLDTPRCPECGYRFTWEEVLDPNRRAHPYLFEHHRGRNFWSFRKTVRGALGPRRFWTSLHPVMPSWPGRLRAYWLITTMLFGAAVALLMFAPNMIEFAWNTIQGPAWPLSRMSPVIVRPGGGMVVRAASRADELSETMGLPGLCRSSDPAIQRLALDALCRDADMALPDPGVVDGIPLVDGPGQGQPHTRRSLRRIQPRHDSARPGGADHFYHV